MGIADIPEIENLSTSEKILLLEDLWDRIAVDESRVAVPQSHKEELDRRMSVIELHAKRQCRVVPDASHPDRFANGKIGVELSRPAHDA